MTPIAADLASARPAGAWYREVTPAQWKAFIGAYLGWVLDGFDFTILTFLLVDIQRSFTVDKALAGALGTITLIFRVAGGIGAGTAADRWGRKGPLMFSILWYSLFSFLGGFSTSYGMLFAIRALFGIGMGGVWAAGMPLTLEHWPAHLRGTASGTDAERLLDGVPALVARLRVRLSARQSAARHGLARDALDRHPAGVPRALHHEGREGEPGLARAAAPPEGAQAARLAVARAALPARSGVDDAAHVDPDGRVPVHVPLDHVLVPDAAHPDAPSDAAVSRGAERRRHRRRGRVRPAVGGARSAAAAPRRSRRSSASLSSRSMCSRAAGRCCGSAR